MNTIIDIFQSIQDTPAGLTLAELLAKYPNIARRTAQRWISRLIVQGQVVAIGKGRARRYFSVKTEITTRAQDTYPDYIPHSATSRDIIAYINQPLEARKPVGYQREFLDAYQPNRTWYLPEPLRRQLRKMGDTKQTGLPAGTYSRAILNRLLIDLSWASSHLEGNTYSRHDTRDLIKSDIVYLTKSRPLYF